MADRFSFLFINAKVNRRVFTNIVTGGSLRYLFTVTARMQRGTHATTNNRESRLDRNTVGYTTHGR